jgi:hypothetical protein
MRIGRELRIWYFLWLYLSIFMLTSLTFFVVGRSRGKVHLNYSSYLAFNSLLVSVIPFSNVIFILSLRAF